MATGIYSLIRVSGSDAGEFLQGQLTQDMERVTKAGSLPAAWCNPKGRVITLLRVFVTDDGYGLVLPASMAEAVCERLSRYRLRADVALEVASDDWSCLVLEAAGDLERLEAAGLRPDREVNACRIADGLTAVNVGIEENCVELMGLRADLDRAGIDEAAAASPEFLRGARIRAGLPEILARQSETYTPHMLNLDLLGVVSFDKGCYIGQEVIARTKFLGSTKRRLMRYVTEDTLAPGDKLSDGKRSAGEVLNVSGHDLLAVTPVDRHRDVLYADGVAITPLPLPYAVPGS